MNAEIHNISSFLLGMGANKGCTVHVVISPFALLCHMLRSKHHWGSQPALASSVFWGMFLHWSCALSGPLKGALCWVTKDHACMQCHLQKHLVAPCVCAVALGFC